jgi:HD superfamily phosphodiesterase
MELQPQVITPHQTNTLRKWGVHPKLIDYAVKIIEKYNIDDSHGIEHARQVVKLVIELFDKVNPRVRNWSREDTRHIAITAAFVHDIIDDKYMGDNEKQELENLMAFIGSLGYTAEQVNAIYFIITNMSWSKRRLREMKGETQIPCSDYAALTALVAECDQLDAYDPRRCWDFTCQKKEFRGLARDDPAVLKQVNTIMGLRVLRYKQDYMYNDASRLLAEERHKGLLKWFDDNPQVKNAGYIDYMGLKPE